MKMENKTIITGYGIISCLGNDCNAVRRSLYNGRHGIEYLETLPAGGYQSPFRGRFPLPDDTVMAALSASQQKTMGIESAYAYCATCEALEQSGLQDLSRTALIVSNDTTAEAHRRANMLMNEYHDTRYLRTSTVFRLLNSTVSMNLAQVFGIGGLSLTVSAACAGGGHAIGLAHSLIHAGVIDSAIVVGTQELGARDFTAFDALGVLAQGTDPDKASRPFEKGRTGLVPSYGAACVILESGRHAAQRNADVLASVDGYGFCTSPHLITPQADCLERCMRDALEQAQMPPHYIDLVAAHATGTTAGDAAEAIAIDHIFGHCNCGYRVAATKALTGHECWMAGVSQVVYSLIQMHHSFIAPYPDFQGFDDDTPPLPLATNGAEDALIAHVLCNAFGFGGTNSSLVISDAKRHEDIRA